jgi:hypothetical protein
VAVVRGTATIHLDSELSPGYESRVVRQIKNALADPQVCHSSRAPGGEGTSSPRRPPSRGASSSRSAEYGALVDAWLLGAQSPAISDERTAHRFGGWSEEQKREWLRTNYTRYRSCALAARDFRLVVTPPPAEAPRPSPRPVRPGTAQAPA